jgi:xanthine/uracil permease
VNENRFLNPHQPQTLYSAVILGYIEAFFNLITLYGPLIMIAFGLAAGGYGIANEKKWGYALAVGSAVLQVLLILNWYRGDTFTSVGPLLNFLFAGALVALLLHPMSRDYQRIWFR